MENYSAIKKETLPFATPRMEFEGIMPKWSKLHRERRILYDLICGSKSNKKKKTKLNSQVQSSDSRVWELAK